MESHPYTIEPFGESAFMLRFDEVLSLKLNLHILALKETLDQRRIPGYIESVPAYTTLTLYFDPIFLIDSEENVLQWIAACTRHVTPYLSDRKTIEIPVCYETAFAPDLAEVAAHTQLTLEDVIQKHTEPVYPVYFIGFAPGFPFLGGMNRQLAVPRKDTPRTFIPAGSVGIAGVQTGVYPNAVPGGWQLIGRTPLKLFDQKRSPASLLQAGNLVKFYRITEEQFAEMEES